MPCCLYIFFSPNRVLAALESALSSDLNSTAQMRARLLNISDEVFQQQAVVERLDNIISNNVSARLGHLEQQLVFLRDRVLSLHSLRDFVHVELVTRFNNMTSHISVLESTLEKVAVASEYTAVLLSNTPALLQYLAEAATAANSSLTSAL